MKCIYQRKSSSSNNSSSISGICWLSHYDGSGQFKPPFLTIASTCLSFCLFVSPLTSLSFYLYLLLVGVSAFSLYSFCLPDIFSRQMSHSWPTSASKMWATPPSASAGHRSTPRPSLAIESRSWPPVKACPSSRRRWRRQLDIIRCTDWNLASTTTLACTLWRRTARVNPPRWHNRHVRSIS